jgi:hypothetical protein
MRRDKIHNKLDEVGTLVLDMMRKKIGLQSALVSHRLRCQSTANRRQSVALSLSVLVLSLLGQPALAQCADCAKHLGADPNLLPKDTVQQTDGAGNSLWGGGAGSSPVRIGAQSTTLQTGTQSTMLQTGAQNTMLQTGTQNLMLQGGTEHKTEETNIEIVIDCSQSMKETIGGVISNDHEPKMDAAKRVLEQTMTTIPADVNVGLRVFGQSFRNDPFVDCQQTALLVPIGQHNRRAIVEHIRQIHPYGLTPLTYALREAASDLEQMGGRKQIILISDGAETCGQDPCMLVHMLTERGFNIKIDIVGLGLKNDKESKIQLNCIANQSGGKFYDSNTSAELVDNLKKITSENKISGKVLTKLKSGDAQKVLQDSLK